MVLFYQFLFLRFAPIPIIFINFAHAKNGQNMILLSFDIEEFDMPLEYKGTISLEEQLSISRQGTVIILDLLKKHQIKACFFSTVIFAQNNPDLIQRLVAEGHELASHTYYHSEFKNEDLLTSKQALEQISGQQVVGLRMPRMYPVDPIEVGKAGYFYNSSINPTFLPGRYNHFKTSRLPFMEGDVLQIPASVTPRFRFPLFWLSFHALPLFFYKRLAAITYQHDQYLNLYFHPWEFMDLDKKAYQLPLYTRWNSGKTMQKKFEHLLIWINQNNWPSHSLREFAESIG
jgi:Polysaccharide deacetylase